MGYMNRSGCFFAKQEMLLTAAPLVENSEVQIQHDVAEID
jgi:hypothetical protein